MGTTSSTDFKVPEKILVYNQCSQLRTSAESNGNLASLKDTTTPSNRGLFPLPDTLKCGYSLLFITTHLPLILMVPMTQFWISRHQTSPLNTLLYRIIYRPSDPILCFQNFAPWLIFTLSNTTTLDNLPIPEPLNFLSSFLPVSHLLTWSYPRKDYIYKYMYIRLFFWWKFPLFKELAPSFLKQHWFFVCLSQKAKTNQFTIKIAGKFNQPYK